MSQSVTLNLPDELYDRAKYRAEQTQRSIEAELLEVVASALPAKHRLSNELEETLAALHVLDDAALQRAAKSHLPKKAVAKLESLHLKRQREGLTEAENQTRIELLRQYDHYMLVRAQASALLKQRGYDITKLVKPE